MWRYYFMKKIVIFILIIICCTFIFTNPIERSFLTGSTNIGLKGGIAYPPKENYALEACFGLSMDFFITTSLSIEISGYRFTSEVSPLGFEESTTKRDLDKGTLTAYPIQLSLKYQFSQNSRVVPYLIIGGDYVIYDHSPDLTEWEKIGFTGENKVKGGIGGHGGLGLNIFVNKMVAINIDVRYIYTFTKCDWSFYDINNPSISISGEISDLTIDFLIATAGIKIYL